MHRKIAFMHFHCSVLRAEFIIMWRMWSRSKENEMDVIDLIMIMCVCAIILCVPFNHVVHVSGRGLHLCGSGS